MPCRADLVSALYLIGMPFWWIMDLDTRSTCMHPLRYYFLLSACQWCSYCGMTNNRRPSTTHVCSQQYTIGIYNQYYFKTWCSALISWASFLKIWHTGELAVDPSWCQIIFGVHFRTVYAQTWYLAPSFVSSCRLRWKKLGNTCVFMLCAWWFSTSKGPSSDGVHVSRLVCSTDINAILM